MTQQYDDDGSMLGSAAKGVGLLGAGLAMTPVGRPLRRNIKNLYKDTFKNPFGLADTLGPNVNKIGQGVNDLLDRASGRTFSMGKLAQKEAEATRLATAGTRTDPELWSSTGQNFRDLGNSAMDKLKGAKEMVSMLPAAVKARKAGVNTIDPAEWLKWAESERGKRFKGNELDLIMNHLGMTPDERAINYLRSLHANTA